MTATANTYEWNGANGSQTRSNTLAVGTCFQTRDEVSNNGMEDYPIRVPRASDPLYHYSYWKTIGMGWTGEFTRVGNVRLSFSTSTEFDDNSCRLYVGRDTAPHGFDPSGANYDQATGDSETGDNIVGNHSYYSQVYELKNYDPLQIDASYQDYTGSALYSLCAVIQLEVARFSSSHGYYSGYLTWTWDEV